jgi:hypothetical protein
MQVTSPIAPRLQAEPVLRVSGAIPVGTIQTGGATASTEAVTFDLHANFDQVHHVDGPMIDAINAAKLLATSEPGAPMQGVFQLGRNQFAVQPLGDIVGGPNVPEHFEGIALGDMITHDHLAALQPELKMVVGQENGTAVTISTAGVSPR